jgi:hypothetical protein
MLLRERLEKRIGRMNRFVVFSCLDLEETEGSDYNGPVVVLTNSADPSFMLFFPVTAQNASVISYILNSEGDYDVDTTILGIYATMLESWKAGDRYLSGIAIDTIYDDKLEKEIPLVRLVLSDQNGMIDSFVRVNFIHAVLLAAMENVEIIISDRLLDIMLPDSEDASERIFKKKHGSSDFPEDKNILNIAKKIMEGKINEENSENSEDSEDSEDEDEIDF